MAGKPTSLPQPGALPLLGEALGVFGQSPDFAALALFLARANDPWVMALLLLPLGLWTLGRAAREVGRG